LFKTDIKVSPTFSLDEFPKLVAGLGEEAKKYGYWTISELDYRDRR